MERKIYTIDATGKPLGRLASEIAKILMGKHKPDFVPYKDTGDCVIVKNVDKIKFTGKKIEQKKYYHYSGYPGGLKVRKFKDLFEKNPKEVLKHTVYHMLPKNRLRKLRMKKLTILSEAQPDVHRTSEATKSLPRPHSNDRLAMQNG